MTASEISSSSSTPPSLEATRPGGITGSGAEGRIPEEELAASMREEAAESKKESEELTDLRESPQVEEPKKPERVSRLSRIPKGALPQPNAEEEEVTDNERVKTASQRIEENEQITFELIGPEERRVKCKWLDPQKGLFSIEGEGGFCTIDDFQERDMQVQNIKVEVGI